ncbi:hypothetical protein D3C85_1421350 [compost metagenome]
MSAAILNCATGFEQHCPVIVGADLDLALSYPHARLVTLPGHAEARAYDLDPAIARANHERPRRVMTDIEPGLATQQPHPPLAISQLDLQRRVSVELKLRTVRQGNVARLSGAGGKVGAPAVRPGAVRQQTDHQQHCCSTGPDLQPRPAPARTLGVAYLPRRLT